MTVRELIEELKQLPPEIAVLVAESDVKPSLNMMLPIIGVAEAEVTPKAPAATTAIAHRLKIVCAMTSLGKDDGDIKAFAVPCTFSVIYQ